MSTSLIDKFCATTKELAVLDLEIGPSGNLSFREDPDIIITPTGSSFAEIMPEKISVYSVPTKKYTGGTPSSDVQAHVDIYAARQDVKAIMHTHAHYVTVLAMLGQHIPVHSTMHADYIGATVQCIPFVNHRRLGFGDVKHFASGFYFLLEKHGGLLLFSDQDTQKIAASVLAFAEIAKLYYEYLIGASLLSIQHIPLQDSEVSTINAYYATHYGKKRVGQR